MLTLIPTLNDDPARTIESITKKKELKHFVIVCCGDPVLFRVLVERGLNVVYEKPDLSLDLGTRISGFMNRVLEGFSLQGLGLFDYFLRIDADTLLPDDYELPEGKEVLHGAGSTMLVGMENFFKVTSLSLECKEVGRFAELNREDSYLFSKFQELGYKVVKWKTKPLLLRAWGAGGKSWRYFFDDGVGAYRLGYEPLHFVMSVIIYAAKEKQTKSLLKLVGYVWAYSKGVRKWDCSEWVWRKQRHFRWKRLIPLVKGK